MGELVGKIPLVSNLCIWLYAFLYGRAPIKAVIDNIRREVLKGLSQHVAVTSARARLGDLKLKIPLVYGLGADHLSRHELPWTHHFLRSLLRITPGALVDIGANVGLYLIWLKSMDRQRQYVGFEPNPACYWYLQELIRYNNFENAKTFPLALSDSRQVRTFFVKRLGDKMGSLLDSHRAGEDKPRSFDLITEQGDLIIPVLGLDAIAAMKIDVEGFELEVLQGLRETLAEFGPTVICEIYSLDPEHPEFRSRRERMEQLFSFLAACDYLMLSLGPDNELHVMEQVSDCEKAMQVDRILVRRDKLESVKEAWRQVGDRPSSSHPD